MRKSVILLMAITVSLFAINHPLKAQNMKTEKTIFPIGEEFANDNFSGSVWLKMLVENDDVFNCPIANVTFEPGCRNSWHKHPGGQILLVTRGEGYYQERGKDAQPLKAGDVIRINPHIEHWHGATADSSFSHLAISTNIQQGEAEWLEPVSDKEYLNLK